jgi:hypothetical protein
MEVEDILADRAFCWVMRGRKLPVRMDGKGFVPRQSKQQKENNRESEPPVWRMEAWWVVYLGSC